MSTKPQSLDELINGITPEIHQNMKKAIELGRWDNGDKLTKDQIALCMQAVIAYDVRRLPESDRVAYIDREKLETKHCGD